MSDDITETPDGLRFVQAKGGYKVHLLPKGTNKALCGHEPKSQFSNRFRNPRAGWWLVRINKVAKPAWCEQCQQARPECS